MREVLSVRERERYRQTERDGSDVTIVALKLAMNSHFPLPNIRNWRWAYTSPCQKLALLVSPFTPPVSPFTERLPLWRWKSQWVHTFHCQFFFALFVPPRDEWSKTQEKWSNPTQSYFVLPIEKMNQINTKNYWKEKKRLCVRWLDLGDKPYLRKSTDRKAQIRKAFVQFSGLICALRSVDFLR